MEPDHNLDTRAQAGPARRAIRRVLAFPVNLDGATVGGTLALFIAMPVALVICLPILFAVAIVGVAAGALLSALGVPQSVSGLLGLAGFVGGLVLSFVVLVRLYRRLPGWIKGWLASVDEEVASPPPAPRRDPRADPGTVDARLAAADATHAPAQEHDRDGTKGD